MKGLPVEWTDARDFLTSVSSSGGQRAQDYLSAKCECAAPDSEFPRAAGNNDWQGDPDARVSSHEMNGVRRYCWEGRVGHICLLLCSTTASAATRNLDGRTGHVYRRSARCTIGTSASFACIMMKHRNWRPPVALFCIPRCLSPLRNNSIPLFIRCTTAPEISGTVVSSVTDEVEPQVKGICLRNGLTLISMDGVGMWHEVGFLARAFAIFNEHGVSVDLVSTSETNVTVSIDTTDGTHWQWRTHGAHCWVTCEQLCRVRAIDDCSAVSLVGRKIRTILPRIGAGISLYSKRKKYI